MTQPPEGIVAEAPLHFVLERLGRRRLAPRHARHPAEGVVGVAAAERHVHRPATQIVASKLPASARKPGTPVVAPHRPLRAHSSGCPNNAMFEEWPGSTLAAGLMKCTAWFTAIAASATPVAMSLSLPG